MVLQEFLHGPVEFKPVFLVLETVPFILLDQVLDLDAPLA